MNIKFKAAIGVAIAAIFGAVLYFSAAKPDENGNFFEETTEDTTVFYEYIEETTQETSEETSTEETTLETVNGHIVEDVENLPTSPIDNKITYNNKDLFLNSSIEDIKSALGEPIVLLKDLPQEIVSEEETETTTEEITEDNDIDSKGRKVYRYRQLLVKTEVEEGVERVKDIEVFSEDILSMSGVSPVGKEIFEITLSYGAPDYEDWSQCRYKIDEDKSLYFNMTNGVVSSWGIEVNKKVENIEETTFMEEN